MAGKSNSMKSNKSNKKKSTVWRILVFIVISLVVVSFLLFNSYNPFGGKTKKQVSSSTNHTSLNFKKEGALSIIKSETGEIINLDIELADNEAERMNGLMDRFSLPENAGMLFIFEEEEPRSFWMKNTFISLDIIYINANKEIVSIQKYTQPKTTTAIPSGAPAKYVLEVNAGFSDRYELSPGDKLNFNY